MSQYIKQKDIRFDKSDIYWLLEILLSLREGKYPLPASGGYTDNPVRSGVVQHAPFESSGQLGAELDERLSACGQDGKALEVCFTYEVPLVLTAALMGIYPDKLDKRLMSALKYISSGWCRRWIPCDKCWLRSKCNDKKKNKRRVQTYKEWRGQSR